MTTLMAKWGNSLAIRISKSIAEQACISEGTELDLTVENGAIVVKPRKRKKYTLDELLEGMTPDNFHKETETGYVLGNEYW